MVPSVVSINIGKYNIFKRPDKALLFVMLKVCIHLKYIQLFITWKDFTFLSNGYNQKEKPPSAYSHMSYDVF